MNVCAILSQDSFSTMQAGGLEGKRMVVQPLSLFLLVADLYQLKVGELAQQASLSHFVTPGSFNHFVTSGKFNYVTTDRFNDFVTSNRDEEADVKLGH